MTAAQLTAALVAVFEGCRLTAYPDSGGVLTIGFGHTGVDVTPGLTITQERADELFAQDMKPLLDAVAELPILEAAAFASFGYNCGLSAMKRALAGQINMLEWVRDAKKNVLGGLVRRRRLEAALVEVSRSLSPPKNPA